MKIPKHALRCCSLVLGVTFVWACAFDTTLREYLNAYFWLPFAKRAAGFEKPKVRRINAPFAGMTKAEGDRPLAKLRATYQQISQPQVESFDSVLQRQA